MRYIQSFSTSGAEQEAIARQELGKPYVALIKDGQYIDWTPTEPGPGYSAMPLTFEITSPGVIRWVNNDYQGNNPKTIQYSKNGGEWTTITSNTGSSAPTISVVSGDTVQFRGDNAAYSSNGVFSGTTAGFKVYGNIMSLIDSTGYTTATTLESNYTFQGFLRNCTGLTDASNLILAATAVSQYCYATMFSFCTSLMAAPELPGTSLAAACYSSMFSGCISLASAPALPATTLANSCYGNMFNSCTTLTTAPELPATTLLIGSYGDMFRNCTSLNYIKCLAIDKSATGCTTTWVQGVASSGTFVKDANATWSTGDDGIPENWTVIDA